MVDFPSTLQIWAENNNFKHNKNNLQHTILVFWSTLTRNRQVSVRWAAWKSLDSLKSLGDASFFHIIFARKQNIIPQNKNFTFSTWVLNYRSLLWIGYFGVVDGKNGLEIGKGLLEMSIWDTEKISRIFSQFFQSFRSGILQNLCRFVHRIEQFSILLTRFHSFRSCMYTSYLSETSYLMLLDSIIQLLRLKYVHFHAFFCEKFYKHYTDSIKS